MGTIAEKLNYLNTTKTNIKNAIVAKGVSVSDNDTFRSYASKIADIEPTLGTKTITANGTYTASDDSLQGYSSVTVDIDDTDLYRDTTDSTYESVKTLSNCGAFPMLSLKVGIEPVQEGSGDPSPTNIRPISGWDECNVSVSGVNVWDEKWRIDGAQFKAKNLISVMPNTSYYFKSPLNAYSAFKYDINENSLGPIVMPKDAIFTTDSKTYYIWFSMSVNDYGTTYNNDISINYPSTDTQYHAYNGHTYTIDLDGTRYGGKLDLVNGVMTVDRAMVDLGTLNWTYESSIFRLNQSIGAKLTTDTSAVANMLCSIYKTVSQNAMGSTSTDHCIAGLNWSNGVRVKDSNYTTVADFKTAMNGVQLVYELATPLTIQLTPTQVKLLLGVNNLWANSGDVGDARYFRKVEL